MNRFLGLAIVTLSFLGGLNSAMAADMAVKAPIYKAPPVVEVDSWTGFYAGFNVGGIWGRDHLTAAPADAGTTAFWAACNVAGACPFDYGRRTGTSAELGGQFGYNWQVNSVVYGIETDIQWTDVKSSASVNLVNTATGFVPFSGTETAKLDWFGTTRGRVGFLALPNLLLYGTGGVAYGSVSNSWNATFASTGQIVNGGARDTRIGWVAGAGVDWKVNRSWIVGLEYLHTELESNTFGATGFGSAGCTAANCNFNINAGAFKTDTVRARVSYQFGGPIVARY
jgi:outer membrane immunogenic protein